MNSYDVLTMRQVAFVFSQCVAALATIEGMKALNAYRERRGESQAYPEAAFLAVIDQYGLGHNDVLTTLRSGQ